MMLRVLLSEEVRVRVLPQNRGLMCPWRRAIVQILKCSVFFFIVRQQNILIIYYLSGQSGEKVLTLKSASHQALVAFHFPLAICIEDYWAINKKAPAKIWLFRTCS
jgi:hypothetical protein